MSGWNVSESWLTFDFQKALKSRGIEKMLDDAREDSRETDQEYLKKGCKYYFQPTLPSFCD